jgi:DNA-directed RNA polymerase subunit RPC12/RpoP
MADKVYCKKCGDDASSVQNLTSRTCRRGGKHELYEGPIQSKYYCKKCGDDAGSISSLTGRTCRKGGNHEPAR